MTKKTVWVLIIVVLAVGGLFLFRGEGSDTNGDNAPRQDTVRPNIREPLEGEIVVDGKLGCLPLKSGETPSGEDCVIGLVGNDGKYYALETSNVQVIEKGISVDTTVRFVGTYAPAAAGSEEAGIFRYDGVLSVRVMQNQND